MIWTKSFLIMSLPLRGSSTTRMLLLFLLLLLLLLIVEQQQPSKEHLGTHSGAAIPSALCYQMYSAPKKKAQPASFFKSVSRPCSSSSSSSSSSYSVERPFDRELGEQERHMRNGGCRLERQGLSCYRSFHAQRVRAQLGGSRPCNRSKMPHNSNIGHGKAQECVSNVLERLNEG